MKSQPETLHSFADSGSTWCTQTYCGILRHSVKLRTLPQDTSLRAWRDDVAYTMYNVVCRSMIIEARYAASASGSIA
jgi:hypothetical protein